MDFGFKQTASVIIALAVGGLLIGLAFYLTTNNNKNGNDITDKIYASNDVYSITYKENNGEDKEIAQKVIKNNTWVTKDSTVFNIEGHSIVSWNTKPDGTGIKYELNKEQSKLANNLILFAQWKPNTLTINYHNDGATTFRNLRETMADVTNTNIVYTQVKKYNEVYDAESGGYGLPDVSRYKKAGYHSAKSYYVGSKGSSSTVNDYTSLPYVTDLAKYLGVLDQLKTNDVTVELYPKLDANTWTVKYDGNGATSGTMADTIHTFDGGVKVRKNEFTRTGYNFSGWYMSRVNNGKTEWYYLDDKGNWINGNSWYEEGKQPSGYIKYALTDEQILQYSTLINGDVITCHAKWVKS